jgi:hypothetical protein
MNTEIQILIGGAIYLILNLHMLTDYNLDAIKESGTENADGKISVSYGVLFDKTANTCLSMFSKMFSL